MKSPILSALLGVTSEMLINNNDDFPQKGRTFFSANGKEFEVAQVGHGNEMNQMLDYVHGYLFSANALLDQLEENKKYTTKESIQHYLNIYAMPIIFMYRQYLELSLKEIYLEYSDASFEEQDEKSFNLRYLFDKKLKLNFQNEKINLYNLKERMIEIEDFLCYVMPLLDIKKQITQ